MAGPPSNDPMNHSGKEDDDDDDEDEEEQQQSSEEGSGSGSEQLSFKKPNPNGDTSDESGSDSDSPPAKPVGRFDILALSGSFVLSEVFGHRTRTGGLSVTLSGPDGRVFGGVVAGLLIAASPVQVIVGSFLPENSKEPMTANHVEPLNATPKFTPANHAAGPSSSQSHGTLSESSGGPGSPMNQGNNSSPQGMANMPWK